MVQAPFEHGAEDWRPSVLETSRIWKLENAINQSPSPQMPVRSSVVRPTVKYKGVGMSSKTDTIDYRISSRDCSMLLPRRYKTHQSSNITKSYIYWQ
jgi:hypothetical protein